MLGPEIRMIIPDTPRNEVSGNNSDDVYKGRLSVKMGAFVHGIIRCGKPIYP